PVRPDIADHHRGLCRRSCRRRVACDGPSGRRHAGGAGARACLERAGERRAHAGAAARGRFVPMRRIGGDPNGSVVALSGGIGGAKLVLGLSRVMPPERLIVVANTGDDFEHLGLAISPDLDTLMYTLAGVSDPERGWGRRGETWTFMAALAALGGETWFQL